MATYFFETITPAEAAGFNPAQDTLVSNTLAASAVTVAFGLSTTTLVGGGRTVVLGTTPALGLDSTDFDFAGTSELFLGEVGVDDFDLTTSNSAAYGNAGNDTIEVQAGVANFVVQGNQGTDTITVAAGSGAGTVSGGADFDTITLGGSGRVFANGNLGNDVINLNGNGDFFIQGGGNDDDIFVRGAGDNTVFGDLGNDFVLVTGIGDNTVSGGDGADRIRVEGIASGDNAVNGNAGDDFISFDGTGDGFIQGGQGDDQIVVNSATGQTVFGDLDDDTILLLNTGDHTVSGGEGDDVISGRITSIEGGIQFVDGNGDLQAVGANVAAAEGDLSLNGNAGDDLVSGGNGDDFLQGGQGDDTIRGGPGDDTISGDFGTDVLTGGNGDNLFVINAGTSNVADQGDVIGDFDQFPNADGSIDNEITFGGVGGNGVNYREIGFTATTFSDAQAAADNLLGDGVSYVLVSGAVGVDFNGDGTAATGEAGSLLFADLDGNGSADTVVRLSGVTADEFGFENIV